MEDLKRSHVFKNLPRSPIAAIMLAKLLNENSKEIRKHDGAVREILGTDAGSMGRRKRSQSQKEYQALDNVLMNLAQSMLDDERLFLSEEETLDAFRSYL